MHSEQIDEISAALAKAQSAMENPTANRINPHFKSRYVDLAALVDAIRKPLSANGLAITQLMEIRETGMVMRTILMHTSGQWLASEYPLPNTARPQEMGSAQTYARRYSLSALVCNAADEDDDATGAEAAKQKIEARGRTPRKPAPNVMLHEPAAEPPHDPETGEIIAEVAAPAVTPAASDATQQSQVDEAAGIEVEDMGREAAMRGREVFLKFYNGRKTSDKARLRAIKEELEALFPLENEEAEG